MIKKQKYMAEKYLMDTLDRMARNPTSQADYSVIYVKVSGLKPKNRHPSFIEVLTRFFDIITSTAKTSFFRLSNGDFVILGKNISVEEVDDAIKRIRQGFASDPILHSNDMADFVVLYKFPERFSFFYNYIEDVIFNINSETDVIENTKPKIVEASHFYGLLRFIDEGVDLSEIIKRQGCFKCLKNGDVKTLFQEFFVAVKDINIKLGSGVDIAANKWLFLHLSSFLDKKILSSFFVSNITKWPEYIAVNLNVASVFTHEFVNFAKSFLKQKQKIIVEVKLSDVLNNIELYDKAKDILHKGKNKILIDEVAPAMFDMMNIESFSPDYVKLFWEPLLEYDTDNQNMEKAIDVIGKEKFVLAKCSSQAAIDWGRSYGIENFQGSFIDQIEIEKIKEKCPNKSCTEDCAKLRKITSGSFGNSCSTKMVFEDYI